MLSFLMNRLPEVSHAPGISPPTWFTTSPGDRIARLCPSLNHLESTLTKHLPSVDSTGFTKNLTPLNATLTKNRGGPPLKTSPFPPPARKPQRTATPPS